MENKTDNKIVKIKNVSKSYGSTEVFKDFSLEIPSGKIIGLLGENGIGKTTLLNMIADLTKPDDGKILVNWHEVSRHTRDSVSYLTRPEHHTSSFKIKHLIAAANDMHPDFDMQKAERLCENFKIDVKKGIDKLSKGHQERVCLMLCLARKAPLYVMDEPMAGFDPKFKRELVSAILTHIDEGQTVIISTHLLRDLDSVFDEVVVLTKNRAHTANADELRESGRSLEDYYMEVLDNEDAD